MGRGLRAALRPHVRRLRDAAPHSEGLGALVRRCRRSQRAAMRIPVRFAANVGWLFTELPWLDRFAAARAAGFTAVEFPWPEDPDASAEAVAVARLRVAMLNMPAGHLALGQRGWP